MDPGRRAMLSGRNDMRPEKDITAPRRDPARRIEKPQRSRPGPESSASRGGRAKYLTQDEQAEQFVANEDRFVLKQSKKKADIRVREGRATPIDNLAFNLRYIDTERDLFDDDEEDVHIDVPQPDTIVESLDASELELLEGEIKAYRTLESDPTCLAYWTALQTLCADRRKKLLPRGADSRVVESVASDVDKILSPKTYEQLEALEKQIEAKLASDDDIDVDYWDQLLRSLLVWKARAQLKKISSELLSRRAVLLEAKDPEKAALLRRSLDGEAAAITSATKSVEKAAPASAAGLSTVSPAASAPKFPANASSIAASAASSAQSSNPVSGAPSRFAHVAQEDFSQATKALYEREVARGVGENEEIFTAEETVPGALAPRWADKYRPRKPRYFNRVQMGYEWNKYNQTHYDHDNPPPKVVQGYKFNIFYPDLLDMTKAPTFKIVREGGRRRGESFAAAGEEDTCLIRFIAGPPYQDVAFRIVDREWDYSSKKDRGFRSSFDKGILQLHFQFKKIFYRK